MLLCLNQTLHTEPTPRQQRQRDRGGDNQGAPAQPTQGATGALNEDGRVELNEDGTVVLQ